MIFHESNHFQYHRFDFRDNNVSAMQLNIIFNFRFKKHNLFFRGYHQFYASYFTSLSTISNVVKLTGLAKCPLKPASNYLSIKTLTVSFSSSLNSTRSSKLIAPSFIRKIMLLIRFDRLISN